MFDVRSLTAPDWYRALEPLTSGSPAPVLVAWGDDLSAFDGFQLGRLGVRVLLPHRPTPEQAWTVLTEASRTRPTLAPHIRAAVGHATLPEMVDQVRKLFLDQGLALEREDRSKTARLLGVSRQAIQQMIRRHGMSQRVPMPASNKEPIAPWPRHLDVDRGSRQPPTNRVP